MTEKDQIFEIAKLIQRGEQLVRSGGIDVSEYSTDEAVLVGCNRLAAAKYLFNLGYRPAETVSIVEDGMVIGVYTDSDIVGARVLDLDVSEFEDEDDKEEYEETKAEADKVMRTMKRVW